MGFLRKKRDSKKENPFQKASPAEAVSQPAKEVPKPFAVNVLPPQTQEAIQISNISLWLDRYEDIFSDFDPRPYSQRSLSDDFLYEAKKVSKERVSGVAELKLLIPAAKRNVSHEPIIKKRLRDHFKAHYENVYADIKSIMKEGLFFVMLGFFLNLASAYILFKVPEKDFASSVLITLFEPASWFLFWEGLWLLVFERKTKKPELEFYRKMSKCDIKFYPY